MPNFEFKTVNTFYDDDIARYLITEKITKKENINIHNLLRSISPSVRIVVTPIENTNDKMGTDRETNFTRT